MAKRLREVGGERKVDGAQRGQDLMRETQDAQERRQKYADWQWTQASLIWLMVTQDDAWAKLPCELRHRMLQDAVRVLFERRVALQVKWPLENWMPMGCFGPLSFMPQYDAFLHDALVKPFTVSGGTKAKRLQYQLLKRDADDALCITAFRPIHTLEQFIGCLDASRCAHVSILFRYHLMPPSSFEGFRG